VDWKYIVIILLVLALAGVAAWALELRRRLEAAERAAPSLPPPAAPRLPAPPVSAPRVSGPRIRPARPTAPDRLPTATPGALPDTPDPVPDSTADGARLGRLVVRSAATRGERGRLDAMVRRNESWTSVLHKFEPPVLLSCVTSGVSASDRSYLGAAQACRSLHGRLTERATAVAIDAAWKNSDAHGDGVTAELQRLLRGIAAGVGNSLTLLANGRSLEPEELATDLIFLLSRLGDSPRRQHLVAGVGDGVLLRLTRDGEWSQETPAAGSVPAVLPGNVDQVRLRQLATEPGDVLVLCSGTTAPFLQRDEEDGAVVRSDWNSGPPDIIRFLWHLNLADPVEREDRAAVAIWESPAPAEA
jgi:hypothetical protein